jgi:hypothetical protein
MPDARSTVLVIGANGALGRVVTEVFAAHGWRVTRGLHHGDGSADTAHVDLDDPGTVAAAMSNADVTIQTVPANFTAETIALEAGHRLLNLAINPMAMQTKLHNRFSWSARGTVILNAGLAPGVTNLVAAELLSYDPTGEGKIAIVVPLPWRGYHGAAGVRFVHEYMTTSGHYGSHSGRHQTAAVPIPSLAGVKECVGWAERDAGWVHRLAAGRQVRTYCYVDSPRLNSAIVAMNKLRQLQSLPLAPFLRMRRHPGNPTTESVSIWMGLNVHGVTHSRVIQSRGRYVSAAQAAEVMASEFVDDDSLLGRGCIDPNEAFDLADIEPALVQRYGFYILAGEERECPEVLRAPAVLRRNGKPKRPWLTMPMEKANRIATPSAVR